jgi:hypothetical protein
MIKQKMAQKLKDVRTLNKARADKSVAIVSAAAAAAAVATAGLSQPT